MTDEERAALLALLQAAEADLAAELRAVRDAALAAEARREETPIAALKKGRAVPARV